ncbi:MAG: hypothetical protein P1U36_04890 [Legionellaceae bacterium]|nr:hypothetical protein [Legionellaceae bacterium]
MNFIKKLGLILLLLNQGAFASKALYSITPETSSTVQVPLNSTANINYRVQNQTQQTQSLSLQSNFGITQVVQAGFCTQPFTLAPNESCLLSLLINGSKITASKSVIGPEICKTNSPFFCSLPLLENRLKVDITNETHILIANNGTANVGFISDCLVGALGGLENCQTLSNSNIEEANGVAVTTNQHLYTANGNLNTIAICSVDADLCVQNTAGGLLNDPRTVYIHNNYLYTLSTDSNAVIKCDISSTTGSLSHCISTGEGFVGPLGSMTIANGYAYIPNASHTSSTVSICSVSTENGALSGCSNFSPLSLVNPSGVAVSGSYAYIIDVFGYSVVTCEVNVNDGSLSNCFDNVDALNYSFNTSIAILNNYLYVGSDEDQVEKCLIGNDGRVSACEATGSDFVGPTGNMTSITR